METIVTIRVVESNGIIDEDAMEKDFTLKLAALLAARYEQRIGQAIDTVYDRYEGEERLNMPYLSGQAVALLNVKPKDMSKWDALCLDYVRAHSKGPDALFEIGKGSKNGGVRRMMRATPVIETAAVGSPTEPVEMAAE